MASRNLETRIVHETRHRHGTDVLAEYLVHVEDEYIQTCVTNSPSKVEEWIKATEERNHLRLNRLISVLDVKCNPSMIPGQESPIAVLQLFVSTRCLIYRIPQNQNAGNVNVIPDGLKAFLANPNYTFVGVGIENYKRMLYNEFSLEVMNTMDLRVIAARELEDPDLGNKSLQQLGIRFLKKNFNGEKLVIVRMSDWVNDEYSLTDDQVRYASLEAYVSFNIARKLQSWYD